MVSYKKSNGETIPIPTWLWTGIGVLAITIAGSIGAVVNNAFAEQTARVDSNTTTLVTHSEKISNLEKFDVKFELQVDGRLERIEAKIDRLLDFNRNK